MSEEEEVPPDTSDLKDLDSRLRRARTEAGMDRPETEKVVDRSALGIGFRVAVELVSALCVGVAIGWGLDKWLGTTPLFLLIFFFLGMAAGILNVYRTGMELSRAQQAPDEPDETQ